MSNKSKQKSIFVKTLSFVVNKVWLLFAFFIISLATLFLLLELLLPEINRYKLEIVDWVENQYQIDINVDSIVAKWSSTGPSLSLQNFSLLSDDKTYNIFEVGSLSLEFDLLASLLNREYSTHAIQLENANIRFYIDNQFGVKLNTLSQARDKTEEETTPKQSTQKKTNDVSSDGVNNNEIEETSKRFFELLVAQKNIEIKKSKLELMTLTGSSFNYDINNLKVKKYDDNHQLIGQLKHITESANQSHSLSLIAEVFHGLEEKENYTNLYLDINEIDLASLPLVGHFFEIENLTATSLETNATLKMWGKWQNKHWLEMDAEISLSGKKKLSTFLSWRNEDYHHGYAELHNLTISENQTSTSTAKTDSSVDDKSHSSDSIYFKYMHEEKNDLWWDVSIIDFDLTPLIQYFPSILSKNISGLNWFQSAEPSTILKHLNFNVKKSSFGWESSNLTLEFSDLKLNSQSYIPVFSDLEGWFLYDFKNQIAQAKIKSLSSDLIIADLFRDNIPVNKFKVDIMSDLSDGFSEVNISSLEFENEDLALKADAKFYFDGDEPNLSLKSEIVRGNVSQTSRYLPTGIMSSSLVEYLDESIKSGKLNDATAILRGPIKEFPYPNHSGVFAVLAHVDDAYYSYLPDWPIVNKAKANLLFEGNGMFIDVESAQSEGNQLNSADINIEDMSSDDSMLNLSLNVSSLNNHGRLFLEKTPLDFLSKGLKDLNLEGELATNIQLKVPLSEETNSQENKKGNVESKLTLKGNVQPIGNNVKLSLPFIQVNSVSGKLAFNETGIIPSKLSAFVDKSKVNATIQSVDDFDKKNNESIFMKLNLDGEFSSLTIDQFLSGKWSTFLSGKSSFKSEILFADREKQSTDSQIKATPESIVKVNFQSDLRGIAIDMPDFMQKLKEASKPINLDLEFSNSDLVESHLGSASWEQLNAQWRITSHLNNDLKNDLVKNDYSVLVDIGAIENDKDDLDATLEKKEKSKESNSANNEWVAPIGITLQGHLEELNLLSWSDFYVKVKDNFLINLEDKHASDKKSSTSFDWIVNKMDLSVDIINIPSIEAILEANLKADKYIDLPWRFSLNSKQGNFDAILGESEAWLINANNVDLTLIDTSESDNSLSEELDANNLEVSDLETSELEAEDLKANELNKTNLIEQRERHYNVYSNLPEMDINCKSCLFNQKDLGDIRTSIRRNDDVNNTLSIVSNIKKNKEHQLSFSANWLINNYENEDKYSEITNIDFDLSTDNVGTLLKNWGFKPSVEDSKGTVVGSLSWKNSPWRFDYKELEGNARLDFGKGYLSEISDEDGRLIALFNLKSILRKLTFDFKDVYKKGFFYDSMGGTVKLEDGIISTYDTNIKGNVADVWLFGITDLKNETVEQHAIVSPHITSSLPVLAAWALEPTTGIIVYLLNKIMEPAIDVATQIDYRVHGSFDNPIVEEIKKSRKRVKIDLEEASDKLKIEEEKQQNNPQSEETQTLENDKSNKPNKSLQEEKTSNQSNLVESDGENNE